MSQLFFAGSFNLLIFCDFGSKEMLDDILYDAGQFFLFLFMGYIQII